MNSLVLMLALESGRSLDLLGVALKDGAQRVVRDCRGLARVRVGVRLAQDPVQRIPHSRYVSPKSFDAIVEISTAHRESLQPALDSIGRDVEHLVNRAESAVVNGVAHPITDGAGACLLAYAIRRPRTLSREEWSRHWLTTHAQIGRDVPGLKGYVQLHSRREDNEWAAQATGGLGICDFDGVALTEYAGPEEFVKILSQPEVVDVAINDEFKFIDPARSTMTFVEIMKDIRGDATVGAARGSSYSKAGG